MDLLIALLLAIASALGGFTGDIGTPATSGTVQSVETVITPTTVETTTSHIVIPQCTEDAILLGDGEFKNGRWSEYVCGPSEGDITVPYVSPPPGAVGE